MTSPGFWRLQRKEPQGKPIPIGFKKGLIEVIAEAPSIGQGRRYRVRCECGAERVMIGALIRRNAFTTHQACNQRRD